MIGGLIAIIRLSEPADLERLCLTLAEGGISQIEITLNTPAALESLHKVRANHPELTLGAGTVLSVRDARAAIDSGAQFVVTPTLQLDVISFCRERGVPVLAGAMTPTEILAAHNAGADFVKLFPAGSLGLEYIKAVLGPLPFLRIVPTGGVTLQNVRDFLKLCPAVGIGGNLVSPSLVAEEGWDALRALAHSFVEACR